MKRFPDYERSKGIEVEITDGATIEDLLSLLEFSDSQRAVVVIGGMIRKPDDKILQGENIHIFNAIYGG